VVEIFSKYFYLCVFLYSIESDLIEGTSLSVLLWASASSGCLRGRCLAYFGCWLMVGWRLIHCELSSQF
jgi:hypothetical protein